MSDDLANGAIPAAPDAGAGAAGLMPPATPAPGRSPWGPRTGTPDTPGSTAPETDTSRDAEASQAPPRHAYDLTPFAHFVESDGTGAAELQGFADVMHVAGASQDEVTGVLRWWDRATAGQPATWPQFVDAIGGNPETIADVLGWYAGHAVEDASRATPEEIRVARAYVSRLPAEMREALEVVVGTDGRGLGDDLRVVKLFAQLAREDASAGQSAAPSTKSPAEEREAIEHTLRTNRARYNHDPELQTRYRELLANPPAEKPLPANAAAIAEEIAQIENLMRTNRREYNRNEALQARYRALLDMRGGR